MKSFSRAIMIYCVTMFPLTSALAYTGQCVMPGGTINALTADIGDFNLTDPAVDVAGNIVVKDFQFVANGLPYKASCDNATNSKTPIYLTTKVPLTDSTSTGWYTLNNYLSIKSQTWIDGGRRVYLDNPFTSESNEYSEYNGKTTSWKTGGKGKVSIMIMTPFIGNVSFSKEVLEIYANTFKSNQSTQPLTTLTITGSITVPQSCELNAGQVVTMDFGNIGASSFSAAGAGNRPAGVNPQTRSIGIKCKNIDAQALLSLRIEAANVSGNAIISDNPDLGFVIGNSSHEPLTPNNINSNIPFKLDDNAAATVPISAWPVSVTGNTPAEGKFTSEGYLRVDFD